MTVSRRYAHKRKAESVFAFSMFILLAVVVGLSFFSTRFVVYQPGLVEEARPMIQAETVLSDEAGALMLTTVKMSYMNMLHFTRAIFDPLMDIEPKGDIFREGESRDEYVQRQTVNMVSSQSNAVMAAYHELGLNFSVPSIGVVVQYIYEGMHAEEVLAVGDMIRRIDGHEVWELHDVIRQLEGRAAGSQVEVTFERLGETHTEIIELGMLPALENEVPKPGMGVLLGTLQSVEPEDPKYRVHIEAGEIGGPSAGLIFALEIYNLLSEEDITRGYRIAGTGTIGPDGTVGVIGGIEHKVAAAHLAGADIFFAPQDYVPEPDSGFEPILNTSDAKERARRLGADMDIVSVGTLRQALDYLRQLEPKP